MNETIDVRLPQARLMKMVTLNVTLTGVRTWKLRQAVGVQLLKLAAFVMGCGVHVELDD